MLKWRGIPRRSSDHNGAGNADKSGYSARICSLPFRNTGIKIVSIGQSLCWLFIVCLQSLSKVNLRLEGGNPLVARFRVSGLEGALPESERTRGLKGTFHWGAHNPAETEPSHEEQLGGSNEDGEQSSPRLRGRTCRSFGDAGCRSSRQGQAGPIREDLLPVR